MADKVNSGARTQPGLPGPRDLPDPGINLASPAAPALQQILYQLGHRGSLKTKAFLFGPPPLILAPAQHWPPLPPAQVPRVRGVLMGTACVMTSAPV